MFGTSGLLVLLALLLGAPYSFWWLYQSGDVGLERVIEAQGNGENVLFGSAVSQDFITYKLALHKRVQPEIIALGSSRVMQFRQNWFRVNFLNLGGAAGNLSTLRYMADQMIASHRPRAAIIGIDFWWFLPQWEATPGQRQEAPPDTYTYSLDVLKKPWVWLLDGKISLAEFLAPWLGMFGRGFRTDRFGIMAQQTSDGFGPDGSWSYTAQVTGQKPAFDYQFADTLSQVTSGSKAFYHAVENQSGPSPAHLDVFAEIWCSLRARGVQTFVFIPPVSPQAFDVMQAMAQQYPHMFKLREELQARGIPVLDFSNPRILPSSACEFVDGFHGGEITYAKILRQLADTWPALLNYVNMERLDNLIRDWSDHAMAPNSKITLLPEVDFMDFGCPRRAQKSMEAMHEK